LRSFVFPDQEREKERDESKGGFPMEERQLKKFLAGLCITGLVSGVNLAGIGNAQQTQSG
jgi:radical SAM modification target selenobiotic family peptide